jgi:serine/threonine-protein kinase 24/25/MST4
MMNGGEIDVERYTLLDKIGRGGFGFVYRALDNSSKRIVAAKVINLEEADDDVEDVQQEISVMSNSNCPQLTKYFASFVHDR